MDNSPQIPTEPTDDHGTNQSTKPDENTQESFRDARLLRRLLESPDWDIPSRFYKQIAIEQSLTAIGYCIDHETGEVERDPLLTTKDKSRATANVLRMQQQNRQLAERNIGIVYDPRTNLNANGNAPERDEIDPGDDPDVIDAIPSIAFLESVSEAELIETAKALIGTALDPDQEVLNPEERQPNESNGNGHKQSNGNGNGHTNGNGNGNGTGNGRGH